MKHVAPLFMLFALLLMAACDHDVVSEQIAEVKGEKGYTTLERTGIRPCLDVCGIWGGYTGKGAKTVLPLSFCGN